MKITAPQRKPRTVTKPYQKHKTDYKIAVEHKLKKLKIERMGGSYSLYIEIRVKGQITVAKSRFNFIATDEECCDLAMKHPLFIKCLEYETIMITESIKKTVEQEKGKFLITEWLSLYRLSEGLRLSKIIVKYLSYKFDEIYSQKGIKIDTVFESADEEYGVLDFGRMASIFSQLGHKEFDEIAENSMLFCDFFSRFALSLRGQTVPYPKLLPSWNLDLGLSFCYQDILSGFFKEMLYLFMQYEDPFLRKEYLSIDKVDLLVKIIENIFKDEEFYQSLNSYSGGEGETYFNNIDWADERVN